MSPRPRVLLVWLCAAAVSLSGCGLSSCGGPHPKRIDFGDLGAADRIEVIAVWDGSRKEAIITDRATIQRTVTFIEHYRDGWIDVWSGPAAPWVLLDFWAGDRHVGDFGLAESRVVTGSLSQPTDPQEIARLARDLGIKWPPG